MRKIAMVFIIALLTILQNCDTESNQNKAISKEKADLATIVNSTDSLYISFKDSLSTYRKDSIDIYDVSSEGGHVDGYFEDSELRLIQVKNYGDLGRTATDYLFRNGDVIYVIDIEEGYNMPFYMEGSKVVTELKNQYYVSDNNLLKWIDDKGKVVADSCYTEQMELLSEQIAKYSEKLKVK